MNIYVGNLNYRVKEGDLQQVMEDYGAVSSVKVVMDRETGKSKGFAFIDGPLVSRFDYKVFTSVSKTHL